MIVKTIDAHIGGQPFRLIVDGMTAPRGATLHEKQIWTARYADRVRRMTILEPRGHQDMSVAVLTEPVAPGSHAGILFMRRDGYVPMSAHGIIGAVTIALERGLIDPGGDGRRVIFDTVAGIIRADAELIGSGDDDATPAVQQVSLANVPSFVLRPGIELTVGNRRLRADIAFGGRFYAIVDSESAGVSLEATSRAELRRIGRAVAQAAAESGPCAHPLDPRITGVHGTLFTSPPHDAADLRIVTVLADGSVDQSAGGTGLSAVMAVLDAMGFLSDAPFVAEGVIGTTLRATNRGRTTVGEYDAILPVIEGRAWITGEHVWRASADDPFAAGI